MQVLIMHLDLLSWTIIWWRVWAFRYRVLKTPQIDVLNTWSPTNPNGTNMPEVFIGLTRAGNYATDVSGNNPSQFVGERIMSPLRELTLSYDLVHQSFLQKYPAVRLKGWGILPEPTLFISHIQWNFLKLWILTRVNSSSQTATFGV